MFTNKTYEAPVDVHGKYEEEKDKQQHHERKPVGTIIAVAENGRGENGFEWIKIESRIEPSEQEGNPANILDHFDHLCCEFVGEG